MKFHSIRISIFIMVCFLLVSCSDKNMAVKQTMLPYTQAQYDWGKTTGNTLVLWSQEPEIDRIYMKRAIENYEKTTGNHIEILQIPQSEFTNKVTKAFTEKKEAPDLLLSYGGTNVDSFCPEENFYDFTDAVWVDDLTDTSINQTIYNGKIIGLPHWEASISGMLYNQKIFDKYHIDIPQNQNEFLAACKTLKDNGIIPVYLPFQSPSMMLYQFPLDTIVEDTQILNKLNDTSLSYSEIPQMALIVQWYKTMAENGYFGEEFLSNDWDSMNDALKSENYAMMLCWDTWLYTDFNGDASKFGLMPAFMGIPDSGTFEGPNLALMIVNKHSKNLETALDFITFLADPYNYNQAFEGIYTAPVFKHQVASISTPQYIQAQRIIEKNYSDSIAWLRIRGFSQMDASCIIDYITSENDMSAAQCLMEMDYLRLQRLQTRKS